MDILGKQGHYYHLCRPPDWKFYNKYENDLACLNRRWITRKMNQHQLEIPKGAVKVHPFHQEPIISAMFQMERHVPFTYAIRFSGFFCVSSKRPRFFFYTYR